jgi:hypothetical protein
MRKVTRRHCPSSSRLLHIHLHIFVARVRVHFFVRELQVVIVGRRWRQVGFFPGALPSTEKFTNNVVWETQVCDILRNSRQLYDTPVEAILNVSGMPEIHPVDKKVE